MSNGRIRPRNGPIIVLFTTFWPAFKKIYYDPALGRASARFIKAEDLVVPYYAVDLLTSPRITHVINMTENELRKMQLSGFYRDVDLGNPGADIGSNEVDDKIDEIQY